MWLVPMPVSYCIHEFTMSHGVRKRGNRLENRIESRPMTPDSRVNIHDTSRSFTYTNNDVLERTLLYLHYFDDIETNIIRISVIIRKRIENLLLENVFSEWWKSKMRGIESPPNPSNFSFFLFLSTNQACVYTTPPLPSRNYSFQGGINVARKIGSGEGKGRLYYM